MMELGALVCVPRNPRCRECPLELLCAARQAGTQGRIPAPRRRRRIEEIEVVVLLVSRDGERLLCRRQRDSFIPGEWVLPMRVVEDSADPVGTARRFARQLLGRISSLKTRGRVVHTITYRKITAHVFEAVRPPAGIVGPPLRWIPEEEATGLLTSSLFRKVRDSAMRHRARGGDPP
jgi:A/G-specific adenine glycosylase